jgi:hypothetical protein
MGRQLFGASWQNLHMEQEVKIETDKKNCQYPRLIL